MNHDDLGPDVRLGSLVHDRGTAATRRRGSILGVAGQSAPDLTPNSRLGLTLSSDATVSDDGKVVGDPTEAALVVLAAKIGADAESSRRAYPRVAAVPFDSAYKFMATFHARTRRAGPSVEPGQRRPRRPPRSLHSRHALATRWSQSSSGGQDPGGESRLTRPRLRALMSFAYREFPIPANRMASPPIPWLPSGLDVRRARRDHRPAPPRARRQAVATALRCRASMFA